MGAWPDYGRFRVPRRQAGKVYWWLRSTTDVWARQWDQLAESSRRHDSDESCKGKWARGSDGQESGHSLQSEKVCEYNTVGMRSLIKAVVV